MEYRLHEIPELLVLLIIVRHGSIYGLGLKKILGQHGIISATGTAYDVLDKLEGKNYVTHHISKKRPRVGGRKIKIYTVTSSGLLAAKQFEKDLNDLAEELIAK